MVLSFFDRPKIENYSIQSHFFIFQKFFFFFNDTNSQGWFMVNHVNIIEKFMFNSWQLYI